MKRRRYLQAPVALPMAAAANGRAGDAEIGIRLIVRADDIGSSHAKDEKASLLVGVPVWASPSSSPRRLVVSVFESPFC